MKRVISVILFLCLMFTFNISASAFGGYAHWEIANRVVDKKGISSTNDYDIAYKSGTLIADIGRYSWDSDYTASDSRAFVAKMMSLTGTNTLYKYFARGWQSHVYQDIEGSVAEIFGGDSDNYSLKCGRIDEYLRDKQKINCPINGTDVTYVCYDLIRSTYKALDNFSPTNAQINTQISNMYSQYHTLIALNVLGMDQTQINAMNSQFNNLASYCYQTSSIYASNNYSLNLLNSFAEKNGIASKIDLNELIISEKKNPLKKNRIEKIEEQIDSISYIKTIETYENGDAKVLFVIEDQQAYDILIKDLALVISEDIVV